MCNLCEYPTFGEDLINLHEQIVHEGKIYQCAECANLIATNDNLRLHMYKVYTFTQYV